MRFFLRLGICWLLEGKHVCPSFDTQLVVLLWILELSMTKCAFSIHFFYPSESTMHILVIVYVDVCIKSLCPFYSHYFHFCSSLFIIPIEIFPYLTHLFLLYNHTLHLDSHSLFHQPLFIMSHFFLDICRTNKKR